MVRPNHRKELAITALQDRSVGIRVACEAFGISETCYRYRAKFTSENAEIADWLIRLTHNKKDWGLGIEVDFSLPAERVKRALDNIIEWRGQPRQIRCDNGPEYIRGVLQSWANRTKFSPKMKLGA